MKDDAKILASLSPEKRKLLEKKLKEKGAEFNTFPLSFAQQRLWFLSQLEPESYAYNIPAAVRLTGQLDVEAVKKCLHEITRRHEVLRTRFTTLNGNPVQVISNNGAIDLTFEDLSNLPAPDRESRAESYLLSQSQRPFDLTAGAALRAFLLRLSVEEHILLLVMHHIISDGWSVGVLIHELAALYDAFSKGKPSPLPKLPIQYADFAHWQRNWLKGEILEKQLAYWKGRLGANPPVLQLPTDRPRPAIQSISGAHEAIMLSPELSAAIKSQSREEGVTPFMLLLAAFKTLLYRYTGQEDICVGTPIANRNRGETEGLIGFFVNTLVMRTDLSGDPSFRELLQRVREVALGAYAHQDLPFEMLVEELQPERNMSHTPLFQAMFVYQSERAQSLEMPGLRVQPLEFESGAAKFDLTLSASETKDGLLISIEYRTTLWDASTIQRMLAHFQTLLQAIVANVNERISTMPLLTTTEQQQLLVDWNNTKADYPQDRCIQQLFEDQVQRTPDAVAAAFVDEYLSYQELNQRANQLAHHLRELGVGPEVLVGISLERSLEMIVGLLGILKAGGAYLPLDSTYPPERLAYMLEDSGVRVLLTQQRLISNFGFRISENNTLQVAGYKSQAVGLKTQVAGENPQSAIRNPQSEIRNLKVVCLDSDWQTISQKSSENPDCKTTANNLAYVIYTSGSTGRPKGVMIQHRSALNLAEALYRAIYAHRPNGQLRVSLNAPLPFDASVQQLVQLLYGHTLHILPDEVRRDGEAMVSYLRQIKLDVLDCVPSQLKLLIAAGLLDGNGWTPLIVLPGGEAIDEPTWRLLAQAPATDFYNMYGPTECTVDSTTACARSTPARPTIGRPLANARLYILDRRLQPVPIGVPGELYIAGAGLSRGYLNRPDLTAEKFIPDPFAAAPGNHLYKTGDLARYLPDGNIEFLGRIDQQVKIRGFRIELGEIEEVLKQHPALREVVVIVREDQPDNKRLVAYIVPSQEPVPSTGDLRTFLQDKLPDYMVPSTFVSLQSLPLLPNGKLDRQALPLPDAVRSEFATEFLAPRTPTEEMLANIFAEVLHVQQVGAFANFFDLGGHSLLATRLISRVRDVFKIELPLRSLFENPIIASLAKAIDAAQLAEKGFLAPPIQPVERKAEESLPLSFAQQRLWFLDQLEPGSFLYNIPSAVRLKGVLNLTALEKSLHEIVRRHEVLRTTIQTADGQAGQVIAAEMILPLPLVDLQSIPDDDREATVRQLITLEAQRPFDLAKGPLLRATLFRLLEDEHIVLLVMHHIISDGWSTGVLIQEVAALYQAFVEGKPSPLPNLPIQYADFARWQRQWLQGEVLASQLAYWKQQLGGGLEPLALPTDRPRPAVQTARGSRLTFAVSSDVSTALKALCQQEGTTLFMTLLAALQTLLYRYTGQKEISVGTPIANRNRSEIEGLIGFFVNTLVLRTDLSGNLSFRQVLRKVREVALGAYSHQDLPFEMLVDALQPKRDMSYTPLFQVMFDLQNASKQAFMLPNLVLSPIEIENGAAKFDLTLFMIDEKESLIGAWEYNTDLFDASTIARMIRHFQRLLESIVTDADQSVATLPILTHEEQSRLLREWNDTQLDYAQKLPVHRAFAQQVERTPDAVAASFGEDQLTYLELNQRANQLGHYLRKSGVGADDLVGVFLDPSLEMLVALLGILKAGGAYVPIDTSWPEERIAYTLADSGVKVLLTQEHSIPDFGLRIADFSNLSVLRLDADWPLIAQEAADDFDSGVTEENLAYVIYTSGSTGKPKGTLITHKGLTNYLNWCLQAYPVGEGKGSLVHSTIAFDATVTGLFAPLLVGRTVKLVAGAHDVEALSAALRQEGDFSLIKITPAHLELLSHQLPPEQGRGRTRAFIIGGENLTADQIAFWQEHAPETLLVNEYGPTETVVGCVVFNTPTDWKKPGSIPIGKPIPNTRIYLLDEGLNPVPVGVPGEMYIGGDGVARGYLHRPDLTAERFVPDPFAGEPGARLYRTGDLVKYLADGNMEFLGRIDHQVKIRGFRIELGEIEEVLRQHPALREVVVLVREDEPGSKRLVAYAVSSVEPAPTVSELRSFLKDKLPEYMVPSLFVLLEAMPLTPNGKIDRKALPPPDTSRPDLEAAYIAPRTPGEQTLADIWAEVLGVERVGIHDNFFELGGDSILSIRVIARAAQAGLHLTPKQLFQSPTVAGLAAMAGTATAVHAEQGLVTGPSSLIPIQRWFFEKNLPEPHHWNQSIMLQVRQPLDPNLMGKVIGHLLQHHDVLRSCFKQGELGWEAYYAGSIGDVPFSVIDLSALAEGEQKASIEAEASKLQASLNLAEGPVIRVALFKLGAGKPDRLLFIIHHLAVDGVSWRILLEDVQMAYQQLSNGQSIQLPPKTTSFQYWARKLKEYAQSTKLQEELSYWQRLAGAKVSRLPLDMSAAINDEASAQTLAVSFNKDETRAILQEVPAVFHTQINDVLLTALLETFTHWTGANSLLVELEGHGRENLFDNVDLSRTVGWFTTVFPVLLKREGNTLEDRLKSIKEQLRQIPGRGIGYGLLKYLAEDQNVVNNLRVLPQADVSFNYLGQVDQVLPESAAFMPASESKGSDRSLRGTRSYLIDITGVVAGGQLQFTWIYSRNVHKRETIERIANRYLDALRAIIAACKSPGVGGYTPSDFPLAKIDQKRLDKLMSKLNMTKEKVSA